MIVHEQLINELHHLDINNYEARIWVALLSRGISTAGELSEISHVPRSRTYDVLESLEKKGFIISKIGKPIRYIAVKPEEVLMRVEQKNHKEKITKIRQLDLLSETEIFKELQTIHNGIQHYDITEISNAIKGRNKIYSYTSDLIRKAKKSFFLAANDPEKDYLGLRSALRNRTIKKQIYGKAFGKATEKEMKKIGIECKKLNIDARFFVVDEDHIIFFLNNEQKEANLETAIHVKSDIFAKTLLATIQS